MTKQSLQQYQTIWSIGRVNWLRRYQPELLVSLYQANQLKDHLLEFNQTAGKILNDLLMYTPDREAWDKTMQTVYPELKKSDLKVSKETMKEIRTSLGLSKKVIGSLLKDLDKHYSKM